MISARHLFKRFEHRDVVSDVSFDVAPGETLALLGTSGSGKTTTLRMLNRLIEPTSGEIFINGRNVAEQDVYQLRRGIGYVIQEGGLFTHYTVAQNVAVVPRLLGWPDERIQERTAELLQMLRLPDDVLEKYPAELSGGQRQRVGLARALAADPPVLLMDEPFGALDPVTRVGIRQEFMALDALRSKTIVLVTHDVAEAVSLADQLCLLDGGRIQQMGPAATLLNSPANPFVQQFFAVARQAAWPSSFSSSGSSPGSFSPKS